MPRPKTVLFICTGNACRSQMAEALLRDVAGDRFCVLSAGTRPAGFVHPLALQTLQAMGVSTEGLESKPVEQIADRPIDIAITVCDNASAECPTWLRSGVQAHWALPDPSFHPGTEAEREEFCRQVGQRILKKVQALAALPIERLAPEELRARLESLAAL